jgi:hypothetical protein
VTLVKALSRQSGLVFIKYAEFCFSLLGLHENEANHSGNLHWKFFGSMLVEVLRAKPGDQTLMFNALPFISKALNQQSIRDLTIGALFAISQICCRQTLSAEYTQAFVRQILHSIRPLDCDKDIKLKGLTVLLFLAMY